VTTSMHTGTQSSAISETRGEHAHPWGCFVWAYGNSCTLRDYRSMTRLAFTVVHEPNLEASAKRPVVSSISSLKVLGSELAGAVLLSAVAGYVDTPGFMALFGLFTAHITGDLVTAGTSLTGRLKFGGAARLVMIPVFMVSVAFTTLIARTLKRSGKATLPPLLLLMTVALAIFGITGTTLRPLANEPDAWAVVVIGAAGVVAMGIQNTLMRNALSSYSPTTIMTGNLTQCTIDLVEMWLPATANNTQGRRVARGEAGQRLKKFGFPLLGFMVGAFAGARLTHAWGLASISVPAVAIGLVALDAWLSEARAIRRERARARLERHPAWPCNDVYTHSHCLIAARGRRNQGSMARILSPQTTAQSGTYRRV